MRALSLTQPWPWIIMHLGKRIENRSRNIGNFRGPLLLHAAKKMTADDWWGAGLVGERVGQREADSIPRPFPQGFFDGTLDRSSLTMNALLIPELPRGVIFGSCDIIGQFDARVGSLQLSLEPDDWTEQKRRWYMGAHAYLMDAVRPTTALVPCKGALGFWNVPDAIAREALST